MITADAGTSMAQAPMTINDYLHNARQGIDAEFGVGYAAAHPDLVATFINACCEDFKTAIYAQALVEAARELR